jgi:hypothetical protein
VQGIDVAVGVGGIGVLVGVGGIGVLVGVGGIGVLVGVGAGQELQVVSGDAVCAEPLRWNVLPSTPLLIQII